MLHIKLTQILVDLQPLWGCGVDVHMQFPHVKLKMERLCSYVIIMYWSNEPTHIYTYTYVCVCIYIHTESES